MTPTPNDPSLTMIKAPSAIYGSERLLMILSPKVEVPRPNYGTQNLKITPITHLKSIYIS